jgi:hypothetical protein
MRWISEPVRLEWDPGRHQVAAFWWRGQRHLVTEVVSDARALDFQSRWWLRRHHRRLVVRTEGGRYFELRGEALGRWTLYRELDDPFA